MHLYKVFIYEISDTLGIHILYGIGNIKYFTHDQKSSEEMPGPGLGKEG